MDKQQRERVAPSITIKCFMVTCRWATQVQMNKGACKHWWTGAGMNEQQQMCTGVSESVGHVKGGKGLERVRTPRLLCSHPWNHPPLFRSLSSLDHHSMQSRKPYSSQHCLHTEAVGVYNLQVCFILSRLAAHSLIYFPQFRCMVSFPMYHIWCNLSISFSLSGVMLKIWISTHFNNVSLSLL
jgi:hypothetical protein